MIHGLFNNPWHFIRKVKRGFFKPAFFEYTANKEYGSYETVRNFYSVCPKLLLCLLDQKSTVSWYIPNKFGYSLGWLNGIKLLNL